MKIQKTKYLDFRNLEKKEIEFCPRINWIYGNNGQGKTNILEEIFFTATGKSFRTKDIKNLINHKKDYFKTQIIFTDANTKKEIGIFYEKNNEKVYQLNKNKVKYDEYIGKLNIITFIPEDINLILGSPSLRREFFNYEISQGNIYYYEQIKELNKVLALKNKILKNIKNKEDMLTVYNEKLAKLSVEIMTIRKEFIKNISVLLNLNYRKIFQSNQEVSLKYLPSICEMEKMETEELYKIILEKLCKIREKEIKYKHSLIGPQRDDFSFLLNEKNAKDFSSQGEKKSIVFSLKISEIDMIVKTRREYPVFLIDDLLSYFDEVYLNRILAFFHSKDIQVFITSTAKKECQNSKFFYIKKGIIENES